MAGSRQFGHGVPWYNPPIGSHDMFDYPKASDFLYYPLMPQNKAIEIQSKTDISPVHPFLTTEKTFLRLGKSELLVEPTEKMRYEKREFHGASDFEDTPMESV